MKVTSVTINDIAAIQHIACVTWPLAYHTILSPGQMGYMLNLMYSQPTLLRQVKEEGHHFFTLTDKEHMIGFAGISPASHPALSAGETVWKLHKLYILPAAQQLGAGKYLLEHSINFIREKGGNYIILNVNRENPAYYYYLKNGFKVLETGDFDIGAGFFMKDYIMGKAIVICE